MSEVRVCATCAALQDEGPNPQAVGTQTFTCRAHPPQIVCPAPGNLLAIWPPTRLDGWCREWAPRQEGPGTGMPGGKRATIGQGQPLG